jgi:hypothetical protein
MKRRKEIFKPQTPPMMKPPFHHHPLISIGNGTYDEMLKINQAKIQRT